MSGTGSGRSSRSRSAGDFGTNLLGNSDRWFGSSSTAGKGQLAEYGKSLVAWWFSDRFSDRTLAALYPHRYPENLE
jgi:hypothetical protein